MPPIRESRWCGQGGLGGEYASVNQSYSLKIVKRGVKSGSVYETRAQLDDKYLFSLDLQERSVMIVLIIPMQVPKCIVLHNTFTGPGKLIQQDGYRCQVEEYDPNTGKTKTRDICDCSSAGGRVASTSGGRRWSTGN